MPFAQSALTSHKALVDLKSKFLLCLIKVTYSAHAEHAGKPVRAGSNDGSAIVSKS